MIRRFFRSGLRDADWLTRDRATAYTRVLFVLTVGYFLFTIRWTGTALPIAHDFAAFWTAARLALQGDAAAAYGDHARQAMEALFGPGYYPPFFYTPIGLLFWLPFGLMPAAAGATLWVGGTAGAYVAVLRSLVRAPIIVLLAYPAVLVCALYGQNALFSAALFGGVALTLDRRPLVAGMFIGCLAYKPQLGVLAPLALLCAGRFATFASAAATVIVLVLVSSWAFGPGIWQAFAAALPAANAWNAGGVPGFDRFASPYAAVRIAGGPASTAWAIQAVLALAACLCLVLVARRRPGASAETAALVVATGFCVPFLGEYDFAIFAVSGCWIARDAARSGWLPYEAAALALLYLSPIVIKGAAPARHSVGTGRDAASRNTGAQGASISHQQPMPQNHDLSASYSHAWCMSNNDCC